MYDKFLEIISDNNETLAAADLKPEHNFREDLRMNSMDIINMNIDIESLFNIKIKEKDIKNINTIGELKAYIEKLTKTELV